MKVLRANAEQFEDLNGYTYKNSKLLFTEDLNGNKIVGIDVLNDDNFSEIKAKLNVLEKIDFKRKIEEDYNL